MNHKASTHVDDEDLARLASNELAAAEIAAVMEHLEECEDCREVWGAVERMRDAALEFDSGAIAPPDLQPQNRPFNRGWLGLAAAVLLVSVVGIPRWLNNSSPVDFPLPAVRSGQSSFPVPLSPLEGSRVTEPHFTWSEVKDDAGYSVEILGTDGELLWRSDRLESLSTPWPASIDSTAGVYYWRVSVHYPDGEETVASPLVSFEIGLP